MAHYGTASGFLTYCSDRGIVPSITVEATISKKLLVASEWLDATHRDLFTGTKVGGREQDREWPRVGAVDAYGYAIDTAEEPKEVTYATYEAAIVAFNGPLSQDYKPPKYAQVSITGALSVVYNKVDSFRDLQIQFAKVNEWLSTILVKPEGVNPLVGSVIRV